MPTGLPDIRCDLLVIGSGMAGMAAALFAARRGIDTVQVGMTGEIHFASGLLDLLGVHPIAAGRTLEDPWAGIARLTADQPRHPYARIGLPTIRESMVQFLAFLNRAGLPYQSHPRRNVRTITAPGTVKTTFAVPESMAAAEKALDSRPPCLLVDFAGLRGFSARQIMATLRDGWPGLRTVRLPFPGLGGELQPEHMARRLENPAAREKLAGAIKQHLGHAAVVGLPAVLGISHAARVFADIQAVVGVPVFEIPTMLPAVTGQRLRECFERMLPRMGVRVWYQRKVFTRPVIDDAGVTALVGLARPEMKVQARTVLLASGRFFGQGLRADRHRIRETIFGLPVHQPASRGQWHRKQLFHPQGHPVHQAGLAVDACQRPCDDQGRCIHPNLFAAGAVLAHQDWIRQKCGSGLAIASAYAAVGGVATALQHAQAPAGE